MFRPTPNDRAGLPLALAPDFEMFASCAVVLALCAHASDINVIEKLLGLTVAETSAKGIADTEASAMKVIKPRNAIAPVWHLESEMTLNFDILLFDEL